MRRPREGKPDIHARGVAFDRSVQKPFHLSKGDDLVELLRDFASRHPKDGAVQKDVFTAGQFGMEPSSNLQQAADSSAQPGPPLGRLSDATEYLQERALPGPIAADDADDLAFLDLETYILERPEFLDFAALRHVMAVRNLDRLAREIQQPVSDDVAERRVVLVAFAAGLVLNEVAFRQILDSNNRFRHHTLSIQLR